MGEAWRQARKEEEEKKVRFDRRSQKVNGMKKDGRVRKLKYVGECLIEMTCRSDGKGRKYTEARKVLSNEDQQPSAYGCRLVSTFIIQTLQVRERKKFVNSKHYERLEHR